MSTSADLAGTAPATNMSILPNAIVWTPEIDNLCSEVARWIRMDLPGGTVYGQQRNGKTHAAMYLTDGISKVLGYPVATVHLVIPQQEERSKSERDFLMEMLLQSGCYRTGCRDIAVLRNRCYTHLNELALGAGSRRIILIIDEAQNLSRSQYGYLIHCFNAIEKLQGHPFFLLIGQPELRNAPNTWQEAGGMQITGRFFAREHNYFGIHPNDIELVLAAFDVGLEDDAPPLARRFPESYAAGFALRQISPNYVEALALVMKQHNIGEGLRLPMQYLRASLVELLHRALEEGIALQQVSTSMIFNALKSANFFKVLPHYVSTSTHSSGNSRMNRANRTP